MSIDEIVSKVSPFHLDEKKIEGKLLYLLISLILFIVLYPFFEDMGRSGDIFFAIFASLVPLAGIYAVSHTRRYLVTAAFLGVPFVAINVFNAVFMSDHQMLQYLNGAIAIAFYVYTIVVLLKSVLTIERVTTDTVYGAISVYLLLGIMWGTVYVFAQGIWPGSFVSQFGESLGWSDFLYFSFSTLTTLGFGDIIPVGSHARSIVITEVMTGIMYLAVFISRLGVLHASRGRGRGR